MGIDALPIAELQKDPAAVVDEKDANRGRCFVGRFMRGHSEKDDS
jgi:hypothetical protein